MSTPAATKKVGSSNSIRTNLNEQLTKLAIKQNAELNLLENFRVFVSRKSALEKEYAVGLQRLVQQFNVKEDVPTPTSNSAGANSNRGVLELWKIMLDRTESMAKSHSTASDLLLSKVAESLKQQKKFKEQSFKKHLDVAQKMNSEILDSLKELTTAKKSYMDLEKLCQDTRQKFTEAESKAKKKEKKAQDYVKKQAERLKACQKRAAVSRNDYLLALVTTNTHLKQHAEQYLPSLMKAMDGDMYDKVREAYMSVAQIQLDTWALIRADFEDFREQASLVSREYVLERFMEAHPVLKAVHSFDYEPFGSDQVCAITKEHGSEIFLDKDARNWAMNLTKCNGNILDKEKLLKGLQSVITAYTKNPEFGNAAAFSEANTKADFISEEIRQLNVVRTKAEARLEALRGVGVDVAKWLQKADDQEQDKAGSFERLDVNDARRLSLSASSLQAAGSQEIYADTHSLRSGGDFEVVSVDSEHASTIEGPKYCQVIFDYKAQRPDEIDIHVGEVLVVLEWDDGDGWSKGRNDAGKEGFFPQNYVQSSSNSPPPGGGETAPTNDLTPTSGKSRPLTGISLRALYDYEAQEEEELTFPEGAIIELVNKSVSGVDDGWWLGHYDGKVGMFPSVVVEVIQDQSSADANQEDITLINSWINDVPPPNSPPPIPPDYLTPDITAEELGVGDSTVIHLTSKPSFANNGRMDNGVTKGGVPILFQNKTSSPIVPKASLPDLRIKSPSPVAARSVLHSDSTNSFDDDSFEGSLA